MAPGRWVRKYDQDAATDGFSPLPTQVIGNDEYLPPSQTREQAHVASLLDGIARRNGWVRG